MAGLDVAGFDATGFALGLGFKRVGLARDFVCPAVRLRVAVRPRVRKAGESGAGLGSGFATGSGAAADLGLAKGWRAGCTPIGFFAGGGSDSARGAWARVGEVDWARSVPVGASWCAA